MTDHDATVTDTGIMQELDQPQQLTKRDLLRAELVYAVKSETHLWVATAMYVLSEDTLRSMETQAPNLDTENIRQVGVGCFVCEEPYDPRLLKRKCKGEPKVGRR